MRSLRRSFGVSERTTAVMLTRYGRPSRGTSAAWGIVQGALILLTGHTNGWILSESIANEGVLMTKIFVNLTTADLPRSKAFYTALGCEINPLFTDDNAACVVWSDDIFFMVLTREYFATFTDKQVVDPRESAQVLVAVSRDSREDVDEVLEAGLAAGGKEPKDPQDLGFMYSRVLEDPDGNVLEFMFMPQDAAEKGPEAYLEEHQ